VLAGVAVVAAALAVPSSTEPSGASAPVVRAAFYYPWFPAAWSQRGITPYTHYHPTAGSYSSTDPAVVRAQVAAMQYGHLDAGIISWWGQGTTEDRAVPTDLAAAAGTGFRWALYYEQEGYGNPSVAQIRSDLAYIASRYAGDPSYLTIGGHPVLFVYADRRDRCGMADRWRQAVAGTQFSVVLKVFPGYAACASQPSAWHQYAPASAEDHQAGQSYTISPGFFLARKRKARLVRSLPAWTAAVQRMVASGEPLQLVTTFNEWGEGTAVESASEWSTVSGFGAYLDVLHDQIPAP
jgi:hypothetical protein